MNDDRIQHWKGKGWEVRCGLWERALPGGAVDHVITDAPFTNHVSNNQRSLKRGKGVREFELSFDGVTAADVCAAMQYAKRWAITFCAGEQLGDYRQTASGYGLEYIRQGVWIKPNPTPQFSGDRPAQPVENLAILHAGGEPRVWNGGGSPARWYDHPPRGDRLHETQKPLSLMKALIAAFTEPGDRVWDPYGGSMTTGVACLILGRHFIGHEAQYRYASLGAERMQAAELGLTLKAYRAGLRVPDLDVSDLPLFEEVAVE